MIRSSSRADASAMTISSERGSFPLWFSARQASRRVSRRYFSSSSIAITPFDPGRAPGLVIDLSRWRMAACWRLSTMYGHMASMVGPTARPFSVHIQAGRAFGCFGRVGPETYPPASSRHRQVSRSSVVDMLMTASHNSYRPPPVVTFRTMYDPSPSSSPAKYAASVSFIHPLYLGYATAPTYWKGDEEG